MEGAAPDASVNGDADLLAHFKLDKVYTLAMTLQPNNYLSGVPAAGELRRCARSTTSITSIIPRTGALAWNSHRSLPCTHQPSAQTLHPCQLPCLRGWRCCNRANTPRQRCVSCV